jgi:hypothetical protein
VTGRPFPKQNLRSHSQALQCRRRGVGAFEDELPLELAPGKSVVNTLAFRNHVSHQAQGEGHRRSCGQVTS